MERTSFKESLQHGSAEFPVAVYNMKFDKKQQMLASLHYHKEFEFLVITEGRICVQIEEKNYELKSGEGIFINSGCLHTITAGEDGNGQNGFIAVVFDDALICLWNAIPPSRPDPLAGFVFKTGRNLALKRLRHNTAEKRNSQYDLSLEELSGCIPGSSLEEALSARALGQAIDRFLTALPRESRIMFLRRYWFGDSVGQIAAALGCTENTVSVRLNRCRNKLRTYLEQEGFFHE